MPVYEYECHECGNLFEELIMGSENVQKYKTEHPCPICTSSSPRKMVSLVSFNFKGGTVGNSGVHDVDYPSLDKAVGRSSKSKWEKIQQQKAERSKIRQSLGTNSLSQTPDGKLMKADSSTLEIRNKAINLYNKAKQ